MPAKVKNYAKNQFVITEGNGTTYFQSYRSIIAKKTKSGQVYLDKRYWDYSTTTGKYRNKFLGEKKAATEKKIKSGKYKLTNLN
tara:strand:+ start:2115 stop:2366 length:252 start_codon:yes stop_codon:yes gene_type:complete